MRELPFTILIPTRERAETLIHTLKTCTSQNYDRLTIIVSDNFSQDSTREVTQSFNDHRIQYINTGKRLSMSHNWEFALSQVNTGFVTILGDDDGFLPGAVIKSNEILNHTGLHALNMNPNPDFYFWPSFFNAKQADMIKVSFGKGYDVVASRQQLLNTMRCKADYLNLPMLYNSFVNIELVKNIKSNGSFFKSMVPDLYSGIAIASVIEQYIISKEKLRISGQSSKSTGASAMYANSNKDAVNLFFTEPNIPYHKNIRYCNSINYGILECFLQAFDAGLCEHIKDKFDYLPFLKTGIKEANTKYKHDYEDIIATTRSVAKVAGLEMPYVESLIEEGQQRLVNIIGYDFLKRYTHPFLLINGATYGVSNIDDACQLYARVYDNPAKFWLNFSTWSFMFDQVFGEVMTRYKTK